jgi:hypothetical protein
MRAALTARLLGDAQLAALVGGRVHWSRQPPMDRARPFVGLQLISAAPFYNVARGGSLVDGSLQIDVWADDLATAEAVAARVRPLVSGWRDLVAGVCGIVIDAERDLDGDTARGASALFGISIDISGTWKG